METVRDITVSAIMQFLDDEKLEYTLYGDDESTDFEIVGFTYNVTVGITDGEDFYLSATHRERFNREFRSSSPYADTSKATGNVVHRKTLKGILSYIKKFAIDL